MRLRARCGRRSPASRAAPMLPARSTKMYGNETTPRWRANSSPARSASTTGLVRRSSPVSSSHHDSPDSSRVPLLSVPERTSSSSPTPPPSARPSERPMNIRVGTSGWQYADWRDVLYPAGLPSRLWLETYASSFDTVEVNSTFYRLPTPDAVRRWTEAVQPGFVFVVKASRYLTHIKRLRE